MVALSKDERCWAICFSTAFAGAKGLAGHSFGNMFLTALTHVTGDFPRRCGSQRKCWRFAGGFFHPRRRM